MIYKKSFSYNENETEVISNPLEKGFSKFTFNMFVNFNLRSRATNRRTTCTTKRGYTYYTSNLF